jgi:hypothetical protein
MDGSVSAGQAKNLSVQLGVVHRWSHPGWVSSIPKSQLAATQKYEDPKKEMILPSVI